MAEGQICCLIESELPLRWKEFSSLEIEGHCSPRRLELRQHNPIIVTLWHAAQALEIEVHLLLKGGG
jgi:hypothetical protein